MVVLGEAYLSQNDRDILIESLSFSMLPRVVGTILLLLQLTIDVVGDVGRMLRGEASLPGAAPQNFQ